MAAAATKVVFLSADLVFTSRLAGIASRLNIPLQTAANAVAALALAAESSPRLVLVDLTTPGLELEGLIPRLREAVSQPMKIIAYGPHVHHARLEAATQAGCDEVLTRGQFDARMEEVLRRAI